MVACSFGCAEQIGISIWSYGYLPQEVPELLLADNQGKDEVWAIIWSNGCRHTCHVSPCPVVYSFHLETNLKVCWVRVPAWLDVSQLHNRHDNDLSGFLKTSNESKNLEHLSNRFRIFTCDRIALIMYLPLPGLRSCWEQIGRRFLAWQGMFLVLLIP